MQPQRPRLPQLLLRAMRMPPPPKWMQKSCASLWPKENCTACSGCTVLTCLGGTMLRTGVTASR